MSSKSPTLIKTALTLHILFSVSLLGDSAGYLAVAIHGANVTDPSSSRAAYEILRMLALVFGIPLSFAALLTGLWLTYLTKWKLLRYPWVATKFLLIISVIVVGAVVLRTGMAKMLDGTGGAEHKLIAGAVYDVVALTLATVLSVFKPGGKWKTTSNGT